MAVPAAVAQSKLTALPLAAESETVNVAVVVPALPSATETSSIDRVGAGVVVGDRARPRGVGDRGVARGWTVRRVKVSFASSITSPFTVMATVAVVAPAAIVRLPLAVT